MFWDVFWGVLLMFLVIFFFLSVEEPISPDVEGDLVEKPALVPSLFPHMPSTLYFSTANERGWHTLTKALTFWDSLLPMSVTIWTDR